MKRLERPSFAIVHKAVIASLREGDPSVRHTARRLGFSVRSFERCLAELGTSYRELVDRVRLEMACHLLADSNERICDIATRLAYANPSGFSRAFSRQMKVQPRVYRSQQMSEQHHSRRGSLPGIRNPRSQSA